MNNLVVLPGPTAVYDELLDRACLHAGMTHQELEQTKLIAEIETKLVAAGRSIKDIYAEWAESTPQQIVRRYGSLLAVPGRVETQVTPVETGWLAAVYNGTVGTQTANARFQVAVERRNAKPLLGEIEVPVNKGLSGQIRMLPVGRHVRIRLSMCLDDDKLSAVLLDLEETGIYSNPVKPVRDTDDRASGERQNLPVQKSVIG